MALVNSRLHVTTTTSFCFATPTRSRRTVKVLPLAHGMRSTAWCDRAVGMIATPSGKPGTPEDSSRGQLSLSDSIS